MKLFTGSLLVGSLLLSQISYAEDSVVDKGLYSGDSMFDKDDVQPEISEGMLVAKLALKKYLNGKGKIYELVEKSRSVSNLGSIKIYTFSISDGSGTIKYLMAKVETVSSKEQIIVNIFEDKSVYHQ